MTKRLKLPVLTASICTGLAMGLLLTCSPCQGDAAGTADTGLTATAATSDLYEITIGKKKGFINNAGKVVIPAIYLQVNEPGEGLIPVKTEEGWEYIHYDGTLAFQAHYASALGFHCGRATVNGVKKSGYIDRSGTVKVGLVYDWAFSFSEGLACVISDRSIYYVDSEGRQVIDLKKQGFVSCGPRFVSGLTWVASGNEGIVRFGYMGAEGKLAIPAQYEKALSFSEGLAAVKVGGRWGYINTKGEEVVVPSSEKSPGEFCEGLAWMIKDGKYGFIDTKGQWVVPPQYEYALEFSGGLAPVRSNGKWGYIDRMGKVAIPFAFQMAFPFVGELARIGNNNTWAYIRRDGTQVWPPSD